MKKKFDVSIIQPGYIPWLGFFDLLKLADVFVIYDDVQFDRRGWRNRNRILSPNGKPHWLTIPVEKKGNYNQLIKDVKIVDENWAKNHLETIRHFYRKAPHFNSIFPDLDEAFKSKTLSLIDICLNSDLEKFIFVSTCSNYGISQKKESLDEKSHLKPLSLYFPA